MAALRAEVSGAAGGVNTGAGSSPNAATAPGPRQKPRELTRPKRQAGFTRLGPVKTVGRDEADSKCVGRSEDKFFFGGVGEVVVYQAEMLISELALSLRRASEYRD